MMIDQSLVNHVESYIVDGKNLPVNVTENILDAYIKLIEQNAELHKELARIKEANNPSFNIDDLSVAASDSSEQDWSRSEYKKIHREAFIEGAEYVIDSMRF